MPRHRGLTTDGQSIINNVHAIRLTTISEPQHHKQNM